MASKPKNARRAQRSTSDGRMAHFDDQTAKDLEFDVVKTLLLNHCHNPTTVDRATQLHPQVNPKSWRRELEGTKEFLNLRSEGVAFPAVGGEEIATDNERLAVRDSVLDEAGFNRIRTATETVNGVIEALEGKADGFLPRSRPSLTPPTRNDAGNMRKRMLYEHKKRCVIRPSPARNRKMV